MSLRDLQPNQSVIIIGIIVKSIKALNDLLSPHINIIVNKNAMFPLIMINIVVGETKTIDDNRRAPHTIGQYNLLHNIKYADLPFWTLVATMQCITTIDTVHFLLPITHDRDLQWKCINIGVVDKCGIAVVK